MKKQVGGIICPPSIGLSSNRPQTRAEQNPVKIPDMNDKAAIQQQRDQLRQEENERANKKS